VIKQYESEWHGIQFSSFSDLDDKNIAGEEFYEKFYCEFNKKIRTYEDLSSDWKKDKKNYAAEILNVIGNRKSVLSIGCGIGYIENEIYPYLKERNGELIGVEPSYSSYSFILDNSNIKCLNGYFPDVFESHIHFDFAYMRAVEYTFNDKEYRDFLKSVLDYGIKDFLVISMSHYKPAKYWLKVAMNKIGLYTLHSGQFWGYMRTNDEHIKIMKQAGFERVETRVFGNSLFIRGFGN